MKFRKDKKVSFKEWISTPATTKDCFVSAFLGAWAGLWIGGLGRIIYETPVSITVVGEFALGGAVACLIIGAVLPKYSRVVFFPFAVMGIGVN